MNVEFGDSLVPWPKLCPERPIVDRFLRIEGDLATDSESSSFIDSISPSRGFLRDLVVLERPNFVFFLDLPSCASLLRSSYSEHILS